jgi:hypothetical protein
MLYSEAVIPFGESAKPPVLSAPGYGIRLYGKEEIRDIFASCGMTVLRTFSDYKGSPDSFKKIQLMVYSRKDGEG